MMHAQLSLMGQLSTDKKTIDYANKQAAWLEEHGQAAKRRRAEQTHNA